MSPIQKLQETTAQLTRVFFYFRTRSWRHFMVLLFWVRRGEFRPYRLPAVRVLALSLLSMFLQAAAIISIAYLVRVAERGWTLDLPGLPPFTFADPARALTLFAVFLLVAHGASAWCQYQARVQIARLAVRYEKACARRAAVQYMNLRKGDIDPGSTRVDERIMSQHLRSAPRFLGRALIQLLAVTAPMATGVVALGALLLMNPVLTVVIVAITLASVPLHLSVIAKGMESSEGLQKFAKGDSRAKSDLIAALNRAPLAPGVENRLIETALGTEDGERYLRSYETRLKISDLSRLVTNMTVAIILVAMVLYFGQGLLRGGKEVSDLLFYFVGLRYCIPAITGLAKAVTMVNVFYPYFEEYIEFVDSGNGARGRESHDRASRRARPWKDTLRIETPREAIHGGRKYLKIPRGTSLALISNTPVGWTNLGSIMRALAWPASEMERVSWLESTALLLADYPAISDDLHECFGLPIDVEPLQAADNAPELRKYLDLLAEELRLSREKKWSRDRWTHLGAEVRYLGAALAARVAQKHLVIVDERGLRIFEQAESEAVLQLFARSHVILLYTAVPKRILYQNIGGVAVLGNGELIALFAGGPKALKRHRPEIIDMLQREEDGARDVPDAVDWEDAVVE